MMITMIIMMIMMMIRENERNSYKRILIVYAKRFVMRRQSTRLIIRNILVNLQLLQRERLIKRLESFVREGMRSGEDDLRKRTRQRVHGGEKWNQL